MADTSIGVSNKTKADLEKICSGLREMKHRSVFLDETIEFLIAFFKDGAAYEPIRQKLNPSARRQN